MSSITEYQKNITALNIIYNKTIVETFTLFKKKFIIRIVETILKNF